MEGESFQEGKHYISAQTLGEAVWVSGEGKPDAAEGVYKRQRELALGRSEPGARASPFCHTDGTARGRHSRKRAGGK